MLPCVLNIYFDIYIHFIDIGTEDDVNTQPNLNILIVNALDPSIVFT